MIGAPDCFGRLKNLPDVCKYLSRLHKLITLMMLLTNLTIKVKILTTNHNHLDISILGNKGPFGCGQLPVHVRYGFSRLNSSISTGLMLIIGDTKDHHL
jgi:hypothetical protein